MVNRRVLLAIGGIAIIGWTASALVAQTPATPSFEVASVKPNPSGHGGVNTFLSGGRYVATGATLRRVIDVAYQPIIGSQIGGGPAWINSERFDIAAKAAGNPATDTLRAMLRGLLSDRFQLRTYTETREVDVYALVPAKTDRRLGPQLKPATIDCSSHRAGAPPPDSAPQPVPTVECGFLTQTRVERTADGVTAAKITISAKGVTVPQLAAQLSGMAPVGRIVVDQTGLAANYDVSLTIDNGGGALQLAATIFTALQEQLGLKLESTKGPVDVLVIDHVEHPTED